ncbi:helix-turn-helix domain-containing protein [Micromonospora sp. KC213]|uniref:helix-turn-helix domain-containing protein n=1 Tax=Micromonospora sp. KC213 TaxID=2530378 RepID=UPI001045747B|nr:helix-turn-helix domain-containing protein [Micromonospora sp. KC213]TDC44135.1 helix-turn-helix domain-containing protein [Micromonospora sp. KC213]
MNRHTVAASVIDDAPLTPWDVYELGIACAIFGGSHSDLADPWYDFRLCGIRPGSAHNGPGLVVNTHHGMADLAHADTVIVPSVPDDCVTGDRPFPPELIEALRRAGTTGARIVSLCNGAFALAAAGLLDGRRATAHWAHTELLAERYPAVLVDDSVLYVDEGQILTSAGLSAGLDLCLHLVRRDLGAHVANQLARRMVVLAHRPGGQAQFIERPVMPSDDDSLTPVLHWAMEKLDRPLSVDALAVRARMSPRTFHRRLLAATGLTPMKWLLTQRVARAQALLETTDLPIDEVSRRAGLGTANNLRRHFSLHVGLSPTDYRRGFPAVGERQPMPVGTAAFPAS